MKKTLTICLMAALIIASFAGCQNGGGSSTSGSSSQTSSQGSGAGETTSSSDSGTDAKPGDETPTGAVSAQAIVDKIKDVYGEDYLPNSAIPAEILESTFGLSADMYTEVAAEEPMIGTHADRVIVVKAAEGRGDEVEAALKEALQRQIDSEVQYPMNVPKVNAGQVVRHGDFVAFLIVGAMDEYNEDKTIESDESVQFARDEVQKAVDAFNSFFA